MSGHHHAAPRGRALMVALVANSILLVAQIIGGIIFASLALLADSAHQATDVIGLMAAAAALSMAARPGTDRHTYGLGRAEVLGAQFNAVLLVGAGVWVLTEAWDRIGSEPEIAGPGLAAIAIIGLLVNGGSAWSLLRVAGDNLNLRAAATHLIADAAGSAGVLVAAIAVIVADAAWVDTAVSVAIALYVIWSGVSLLRDSGRVLLEGAPEGIDLERVTTTLEAPAGVVGVHHLHVWSLSSEQAALSAHIVLDHDTTVHEAQKLTMALERDLAEHHNISHTTLAVECDSCEVPDCEIPELADGASELAAHDHGHPPGHSH